MFDAANRVNLRTLVPPRMLFICAPSRRPARLGTLSRKTGRIAPCAKRSCPGGTWTRTPVICGFAWPS